MLIRIATPYGWSAPTEVHDAIAVGLLNAGTAQHVVEEERETVIDRVLGAFETAAKFVRLV